MFKSYFLIVGVANLSVTAGPKMGWRHSITRQQIPIQHSLMAEKFTNGRNHNINFWCDGTPDKNLWKMDSSQGPQVANSVIRIF